MKWEVGFPTKEYMCVTKSFTISLRSSESRVFSSIAAIMLGFHLCGIAKYLLLEEVDMSDNDGVDERVKRSCQTVRTQRMMLEY